MIGRGEGGEGREAEAVKMKAEVITGSALDVLQTLEAGSAQTCVTSPPYFGLRDYGINGQIGLEETPERYVAKLVEVFREVRRVLRDDGTCWVNLGDSYWGGKGENGSSKARATAKERGFSQSGGTVQMSKRPQDGTHPEIKPKDLVGIPWMVAFALRADGWYLRSDIIWAKPNPMPESVTDRPTKAHEYLFLLSKGASYFYDADAVREPYAMSSWTAESDAAGLTRRGQEGHRSGAKMRALCDGAADGTKHGKTAMLNAYGHGGRNRRSVWTVNTRPFKEAHFATFPEKLIEPCIFAGSKEGDTVLDPFSGAGTTGVVAIKHGRHFVGIELNPSYAEMSRGRIQKETRQPLLTTAALLAESGLSDSETARCGVTERDYSTSGGGCSRNVYR